MFADFSSNNISSPNKYREYIAQNPAPKKIFHQTYRVRIFLGDFNSDPTTWVCSPPSFPPSHFLISIISFHLTQPRPQLTLTTSSTGNRASHRRNLLLLRQRPPNHRLRQMHQR